MRFADLPETVKEVRNVVKTWKKASSSSGHDENVVHLSKSGASEAAFKVEAPGKRILHLATHGFFLGGKCESALDNRRDIAGPSMTLYEKPPSVTGENPLLLSGLALAGFNNRDAAGPDEEDGVLTAEEIAAMDLSGVEWAVLSACDTGVGEIKTGEGVFGLRRAFQIAGVKTLIMSLWSVEDEATREWMKELYTARFMEGRTTAESVREAGLGMLQRRRDEGESTHPFYWGAFVAAGDWR
jgi:CHAT domain-containing protein